MRLNFKVIVSEWIMLWASIPNLEILSRWASKKLIVQGVKGSQEPTQYTHFGPRNQN